MEASVKVSKYVPAYVLNGSRTAIEQFRKVNGTDAYRVENGIEVFYNQLVPLRRVMVARDKQPELSTYIADAFRNLFLEAQRVSVIRSMTQETVNTPPYLNSKWPASRLLASGRDFQRLEDQIRSVSANLV
jgi:hypothetical protein